MVYVEIILAALKAIPALIDGIGKIAEKIGELAENQRIHTLELQFQNDLAVAKSKGDTHGLEILFGKRPTPKP